ncbi:MAG TPA: hypothetical protein VK447_19695 [Myxococcaceae bacterium]|nr:hypothetical protein [Myxococcaceae bacterium]
MKLKIAMALCVVGTLVGTSAEAGYRYVTTLRVDPVARKVKGSLSDTRATADSVQYIGCNVGVSVGSYSPSIYCVAQDANRVVGSCSTSEQVFVQVLSMLQPDSILSFEWNANGTCTNISVENFSSNTPKAP